MSTYQVISGASMSIYGRRPEPSHPEDVLVRQDWPEPTMYAVQRGDGLEWVTAHELSDSESMRHRAGRAWDRYQHDAAIEEVRAQAAHTRRVDALRVRRTSVQAPWYRMWTDPAMQGDADRIARHYADAIDRALRA